MLTLILTLHYTDLLAHIFRQLNEWNLRQGTPLDSWADSST